MRVIGLTGGIASGKSLVAQIFRELGARVIDADAVAREVVKPGSDVLRAIADTFGPLVLQADGTLNRKALAERIFKDPQARARLNAITHPAIRRRIAELVAGVRAAEPNAVIVVEIPLLLDVTPPDAYTLDGVVVVAVDETTQQDRLMAREGISERAARQRLESQRPLGEKIPLATWVIDNSGSPQATRQQVEALWRSWRESASAERPSSV